ncbi:putative U box domain, armadillo-like helical, Zinc finger, RING/FYVE/PHD-type [Helianthus annuus]|uniref:RING-type E3 ubiquitin transferase n=1 Tax=Helianthus annuus TaxID=4232 RepID=A0A251SGS9_HELAN|nr:U-box domain-containing protein 5 [Helianthus annuus]KAF5768901.1 putative U box domain, armadillo-like helical, Zinc finger, RING/FYVE/PHD-type [Helianthus annuus]KAJ0464051.1 putative U box domain, armadillo-like helical, Zinc finger, RING/FYVE/PHD-type [Helianthus annuus]KAJ0485591.1 putative U box domain, armadillo-like helical, Zinc finger, RING/FYVE/PHD-type [Helianthus annuus]KAJ0656143.1 putative U box domain, armadillo-like helical, Zinc finger, RING/FYVE/PHD-type [Helianthus annuus
MGTNVTEVVDRFPSPYDIKVHSVMCTQLIKLVDRVSRIIPEIEAAKPRCSSGLDCLCSLTNDLDKAKELIRDCCESSKLYLALKGNTVLSRCNQLKNALEKNLREIQNMVLVMLASKIAQIIGELSVVKFSLNPSEEEAGKAVKSLLSGNCSDEESEKECIRIAAQKLQITSQKALLLERRSIRKLEEQLDEGSNKQQQQKKQILQYLLRYLNKHGKFITSGPIENDNNVQNQDYRSQTVDFHVDRETDMSATPPEEFKCSLSHKLMYDPVVIDSGQTFERTWIQKWLEEGHDTCPKTNKKLSNRLLMPNTAMKEQISNWCGANGITVLDPFIPISNDSNNWEDSCSSIDSLSSMYSRLQLPIDYSSSSMGSFTSLEYGGGVEDTPEVDDKLSTEIDDALPWESRCKFVEDLMTRLENDDRACKSISCETFVGSLVRFLKVSRDINDVKAQRIGCSLLQVLVTKCRSIQYLNKDAYQLIAEFLESEVTEEALAITEELSACQNCRSEIASSGSLTYIFKILDTRIREIQIPALKILYNLTSTRNVRSLIVSSELIPKLVTLSEDDSLSRYCIAILTNFCENEDDKNIIAETKGCISVVAKALDSDNREEQEHALDILLSLCSHSIQYRRLVMDEDVYSPLALLSSNANDKGKAKARAMIRLLGDTDP